MPFQRKHALNPALDISGTLTPNATLNLSEEPTGLGQPTGVSGTAAVISSKVSTTVTITGLTGMTANSVGRFLTFTGAASAGNNGTFIIASFISASSVTITNSAGVAGDVNNGAISWVERQPYSLQDDLNYIRTDRAAIKGVSYSGTLPTYQRPTAIGTSVPANLSNLAGKTTDAKTIVSDRKFVGASISVGNSSITITSAGNLKHATTTDRTGIPIWDGADVNDNEATYVHILNPTTGSVLKVLLGADAGKIIFGRTRAGTSTSPNSVEIELRATNNVLDLTSSVAYTWEPTQPTTVDLLLGYRQTLDQLTETALRNKNAVVGTSGGTGSTDGITEDEHRSLRQLIHFIDNGPADGFASGAYREIVGQPFPTSVIWYESNLKLQKIVEAIYTRNGNQVVTQVVWKMYDTDGLTVLHTVTDTITYDSNIFESSRTRTIA